MWVRGEVPTETHNFSQARVLSHSPSTCVGAKAAVMSCSMDVLHKVIERCSVCVVGLQDCNQQFAAEKEAHRVTSEAYLAAKQHATILQTDLKTVKLDLAAQMQSRITATDNSARLQVELETAGRDVASLQGQVEAALHDLAAEQQRHRDAMQTNEDLQSQLQGTQQELSAEQTACENAKVQASEAEQSASSLESRLQTIQQLQIERHQDHLFAAADLRSESRAAQGSLETTRQ